MEDVHVEISDKPAEHAGVHRAAGKNENAIVDSIAQDTKDVKSVTNANDTRESNLFTFWQACGLNTMNMFGTGPLITIPYCIASVDPAGPHAMIGYGIACVACACDSLVWGEIGSMWPYSGGSYVYLREMFGPDKWGRFFAFMFIWQFFVSGPAEVASGFIAIAEYLVYFSPETVSYGYRVMISLAMLFFSMILLYRKIDDVGRATLVLWGITIFAIVFTLISGFSDWDSSLLESDPGTFDSAGKTIWAIAAATRFGVYDMTGYYDVANMGGEVKNPRKTIPYSCIITCCVVAVIYVLVYLAVLGHLDWRGFVHMYGDDFEGDAVGIMSTFTESRWGSKGFAYFITIIVCATIFGSVFAMLCGFGYLPYAAARDGYFFSFFAHRSTKHEGLADYSLLTIGGLSACWCFFSLDVVIDAMTTLLVLCQFIGQSVGLMWYKYHTPAKDQPAGWKMPLYPLPCIIQATIFFFIFITSDSFVLWGSDDPILELSIGFLVLGAIMFLARSKHHGHWPFNEEGKQQQEVAVNDKQGEGEEKHEKIEEGQEAQGECEEKTDLSLAGGDGKEISEGDTRGSSPSMEQDQPGINTV